MKFVLFLVAIVIAAMVIVFVDISQREKICETHGEKYIRTGEHSDPNFVFCVNKAGVISAFPRNEL